MGVHVSVSTNQNENQVNITVNYGAVAARNILLEYFEYQNIIKLDDREKFIQFIIDKCVNEDISAVNIFKYSPITMALFNDCSQEQKFEIMLKLALQSIKSLKPNEIRSSWYIRQGVGFQLFSQDELTKFLEYAANYSLNKETSEEKAFETFLKVLQFVLNLIVPTVDISSLSIFAGVNSVSRPVVCKYPVTADHTNALAYSMCPFSDNYMLYHITLKDITLMYHMFPNSNIFSSQALDTCPELQSFKILELAGIERHYYETKLFKSCTVFWNTMKVILISYEMFCHEIGSTNFQKFFMKMISLNSKTYKCKIQALVLGLLVGLLTDETINNILEHNDLANVKTIINIHMNPDIQRWLAMYRKGDSTTPKNSYSDSMKKAMMLISELETGPSEQFNFKK